MENAISADTLLSLDVDVPDNARGLGPLLTPPNMLKNSLLPPNNTVVISTFVDSANCVATAVSGANTAMSDDTSNPLQGSFSPVAEFAPSASSRRLFLSLINAGSPVNLTGKIVSFAARVIRSMNLAGFECRIRLYSAGTPVAPGVNYHTFNTVTDGSQRPLIPLSNEWMKVSTAISRFTAVGTGADLTAITYAGYEIVCPSTATPWRIALGNISAYDNALIRAAVVVMFDGVYRSQWNNAAPILKKYDFPAVLYPASASLNLRTEPSPVWNTKRIGTVAASPTSPLIRVTLASPGVFADGKSVAVAGIVGATDNGAAMTGTNVYPIIKVDASTFDLAGSVFGGAFDVNSRADANFSVTLVTNVDASPVDGSNRVTVADAGIWETGGLVTVGGVTGVATANRLSAVTKIDGSTTSFSETGTVFSGAYTGGGYVIYALTSGSTFMTTKQLENLQDINGWQIGSYTNRSNNRADFMAFDADGVARDFQKSQAYLMSRGFKGLQDCVYFNDTQTSDIHIFGTLKHQYRTVRQYYGNVATFKGETIPVGDAQAIRSFGVFAATTTATIT
ncbi:hypothetical protein [Janthinobacterium sp.]|uniref:hypothetical protein n=1 Tax=Janthinobacterium sp. TaxID=1871054 RepID=UPI00293D47C8|nr:hypothetical protein [Janthinobacterium sp.]